MYNQRIVGIIVCFPPGAIHVYPKRRDARCGEERKLRRPLTAMLVGCVERFAGEDGCLMFLSRSRAVVKNLSYRNSDFIDRQVSQHGL